MPPFDFPMHDAQQILPQYVFVRALSPSVQKAAFHVQDTDGNDLCLKIVNPAFRGERLLREVRALQLLRHQNIACFVEYSDCTKGGQQIEYLVEEFIEGRDLTNVISDKEPWDQAQWDNLFAKLCDGLDECRVKQVVHRDLKPSNVRVRVDNEPVIIDFGLSRHLDLISLTRTGEGARIGTPLYYAPEQFVGTKHDIDHRTDLFSLGVIMFEAMCGAHPFGAPTTALDDLEDAICKSTSCFSLPEFQLLPANVQVIIQRLLEKERARRPYAASEVARILRG